MWADQWVTAFGKGTAGRYAAFFLQPEFLASPVDKVEFLLHPHKRQPPLLIELENTVANLLHDNGLNALVGRV